MQYSTFNKKKVDALLQPMFLGEPVNVSRYDIQKYPLFDRLIQKQLSFFWRPEEIDLTIDRKDFMEMGDHEKHIFLSNLKYQTLLDSVQGRSPNVGFLPLVSIPELETWIETWAFSETIHSRSYTHIIRNIVREPSLVFDDIVTNKHICKRAEAVTFHYDHLIEQGSCHNLHGYGVHTVIDADGSERVIEVTKKTLMKAVYMALISVYCLEAIRFYVSFACTFAFAERGIMEGNAKIVKLIARDEALHKFGAQKMIEMLKNSTEGEEWKAITKECEAEAIKVFEAVADQEVEWSSYLFKDGSMIGLNAEILGGYAKYITNSAMISTGFKPIFENIQNPLPWMSAWLQSDNVQVAPQEAEISSYLVGAIDNKMEDGDLDGFEL